ncbi:hypothetical protein PHISCL_08898 [Aspergillus sclerotialis]|uniref:GST N-terminal domain-containing protein n=1 Tax=Aspergillus sclerotialis TaxID=2070753 RepID=A0A3A2Z6N6_9EURO|nr:hypothetical protein PHISCL_08898 [Aspergillus sclerotialis]
MSDTTQEPYVLCHDLFSSCSLMVRLAIAVSKTAQQGHPVQFVERQFDIQHKDEIDGFYMCKENPTSQVPALIHPTLLVQPPTNSLDITFHLFDVYPNLCPPQFAEQIVTFLKKLHQINLSTLVFHNNPSARERVYEASRRKLLDPAISAELRGRLEKKLAAYVAPILL